MAFIFYYCCTGLFLLVFLFLTAAEPTLFAPAALLLAVTAALFWRVDKAAFGLGIASLVLEVVCCGIALTLAMLAAIFSEVWRWQDRYSDLLDLDLMGIVLGLSLALLLYCGLSVAFFVLCRRAFGIGGPPRPKETRPEPPPEDPWAL